MIVSQLELGPPVVLLSKIMPAMIPHKFSCPSLLGINANRAEKDLKWNSFPYTFEQIPQICVTDPNNMSPTVNKGNSEIENEG